MKTDILDIIKKDFYPDQDRKEIQELIKHFYFANALLQAGPSLFIKGLENTQLFFDTFNEETSFFSDLSVNQNHVKFCNFILKEIKETEIKEKKDYLYSIFNNIDDLSSYLYSKLYSQKEKEKEFLDFLHIYGVYTPGKSVSHKKTHRKLNVLDLISENEAKKIDELYKLNSSNFTNKEIKIDFNEIQPYIERAKKISEKYNLNFLNVSLLDMIHTENLNKKLDDIEQSFSHFKNRFHLQDSSIGYGQLGYIFDKTLLPSMDDAGHFWPFNKKSPNCGVIKIKSDIDFSQEEIGVLEHEYTHSIDWYAGKKIDGDDFFSHLPLEKQIKNPDALEALRKVVYSVSDLENEYLTVDEANSAAFNFNKDIFKTLLIHSFGLVDYSKIEQNKVDKVIFNNQEKILNICDTISWLNLKNKKEFNDQFLNEFLESDAFPIFYNLYYQIGGRANKTQFMESLKEPLNLIKENIYEYNIKRDINIHTFFNNPSDFAKDVSNLSINLDIYMKEACERFAWAVGGSHKKGILPGVLQGFKDFCHSVNIALDDTKVLNKELLSEKLKDLDQPKIPSSLYSIKWNG